MASKIRPAVTSDLDFIFDLIYQGAIDRHFNPLIAQSPNAKQGFYRNLQAILTERQRLDNNAKAYASIYEVDGASIGFLIISAMEGQSGNELWMCSVTPTHRKQGYGSKLLDFVLPQFKSNNRALYARCEPESEIMFQMLLKRGFELISDSSSPTRILVMPKK